MKSRKILSVSAGTRLTASTIRPAVAPVLDECPWKEGISEEQAKDLERFERFLRS